MQYSINTNHLILLCATIFFIKFNSIKVVIFKKNFKAQMLNIWHMGPNSSIVFPRQTSLIDNTFSTVSEWSFKILLNIPSS